MYIVRCCTVRLLILPLLAVHQPWFGSPLAHTLEHVLLLGFGIYVMGVFLVRTNVGLHVTSASHTHCVLHHKLCQGLQKRRSLSEKIMRLGLVEYVFQHFNLDLLVSFHFTCIASAKRFKGLTLLKIPHHVSEGRRWPTREHVNFVSHIEKFPVTFAVYSVSCPVKLQIDRFSAHEIGLFRYTYLPRYLCTPYSCAYYSLGTLYYLIFGILYSPFNLRPSNYLRTFSLSCLLSILPATDPFSS